MLTSLSLTNFKSWKQITDMRLAPITGLFGANSSGKTSVLQVLLMLKQTVDSSDRAQVLNFGDDRSLVSLGTFQDVVFQHNARNHLSWQLRWTLPQRLKVVDPEDPNELAISTTELGFSAEVAGEASGPLVVDWLTYRVGGLDFTMRRKSNARDRYELFVDPGAMQFTRRRGRPWDLPPPAKCYGFPDQVKAYYQDAWFLSDFELAFEEFFDRVFYLGPLREYPRREYTWAGGQPEDVGRRGERAVDALLAARERGLTISRGKGRRRWSLEEYVAWWLRELGLIHAFSVEPIAEGSTLYRVRVQQTPDAPSVLLTEVGFGVSQILPVLVLCYYVPEGSTLLLEQPEIHLHPRVQAGLADVFIDAIKVRKIQIVVESHSEHLLLRLQRRVAEQKNGFTNAEAALYFCELKGGSSHLVPLDLDEYGNIRNWPKGFFGDAFEETAATTRAAMERKQRAAA